jgi:hypothetical protein
MRTHCAVMVVIFFGSLVSCPAQNCDRNSRELVASAYSAAFIYPDRFVTWVTDNASLLKPGGRFYRCVDRISTAMINTAFSQLPSQDVRESAMNIATTCGRPDLGKRVADDMIQNSVDLYRLGNQLLALKRFVPSILEGDVSEYEGSEFYQRGSFAWQLMAQIESPEYIRQFKEIFFRVFVWYLVTLTEGLD